MPYTTLRRKTPLKRTGWKKKAYPWARNPKPRKPLAQKSTKQTRRDREYTKARREFLELQLPCKFCYLLDGKNTAATEVHHARGRNGSLLVDKRFFVASCRAHREWPHENPERARALGLLAPAHEWNVAPRG